MSQSVSRNLLRFAVLAFGIVMAHSSAFASTIYTFSLTPTSGGGNVSGIGTITLASAVPTSGNFDASQGGSVSSTTTDLLSLVIHMSDGTIFSLAQENSAADITFFDDKVTNFSYADNNYPILPEIGIGGSHYDYSTNGNFSGTGYTGGTISFNPTPVSTPAATPEPSSFVLLATPFLTLASRRVRNVLTAAR